MIPSLWKQKEKIMTPWDAPCQDAHCPTRMLAKKKFKLNNLYRFSILKGVVTPKIDLLPRKIIGIRTVGDPK